jgi:uncharacterized membrane protein
VDLGPLHPIVVHFAIALLVTGVLFRLASLLGTHLLKGRLAFMGPAACVLLLAGTAAAYMAVESGEAASGDAEAIPGVEPLVDEHADWAGWTLRLFAVVVALEGAGLVLVRWGKAAPALLASGGLGLAGLYLVYETGEHGGALVFSHAGGVGTRTRDPRDIGRLLRAGLYQQAVQDRGAGRSADAARLVELLASRFPADLDVQLLLAESQLEDHKDPAAATATLSRLQIPKGEPRLRLRHGILLADALVGSGHPDAARATLQNLKSDFADDGQLKERLRRLEATPATSGAASSPAPSPAPTASPVPEPSAAPEKNR